VTAVAQTDAGVVVAARDLRIAYGGLTVLDQVDMDIPVPGEVVISGRSGSGKTSLLLVLAGLVAPTGGTVEWPRLDPDQAERRGQIAMVFQAPSLIPELTAGENVCLPLRLRGWAVEAAAEAAAEALGRVGLDEAHSRVLPSEMSGGEQQRGWPGPSPPVPSSSWPTSPPAPSTGTTRSWSSTPCVRRSAGIGRRWSSLPTMRMSPTSSPPRRS
jgi:ABC-type transport system involved in cytochrome bd biosynthesis fused ATPase/permease subunit